MPERDAAVTTPASPTVAVGTVVLNFRGSRHIEQCLASLLVCEPAPARVLVVDNGSPDDSVELIRAWASRNEVELSELVDDELPSGGTLPTRFALLRLTGHRGSPAGNNAGLRVLLREQALTHFLLLDNDTEVAPDYFAELERAIGAVPDVGMLSGTIFHFDDRERVWYAGGRTIHWRALVAHLTEVPDDRSPVPTGYVVGCAMVVSRGMVERLGPLPECYYPVYSEDAEYSLRARRTGLPVMYAPGPVVYHKIGSSVGRAVVSPAAMYMDTRHRGFYVRRNLAGWERAAAMLYLAVTKPGRAFVELLRGRPAMAGAILRGAGSGLFSRAASRESAPF